MAGLPQRPSGQHLRHDAKRSAGQIVAVLHSAPEGAICLVRRMSTKWQQSRASRKRRSSRHTPSAVDCRPWGSRVPKKLRDGHTEYAYYIVGLAVPPIDCDPFRIASIVVQRGGTTFSPVRGAFHSRDLALNRRLLPGIERVFPPLFDAQVVPKYKQ